MIGWPRREMHISPLCFCNVHIIWQGSQTWKVMFCSSYKLLCCLCRCATSAIVGAICQSVHAWPLLQCKYFSNHSFTVPVPCTSIKTMQSCNLHCFFPPLDIKMVDDFVEIVGRCCKASQQPLTEVMSQFYRADLPAYFDAMLNQRKVPPNYFFHCCSVC